MEKRIILMEGQLTELSKNAFVAIVTNDPWQQKFFTSLVLLTASVNQIPSSKRLLYLNYLQ